MIPLDSVTGLRAIRLHQGKWARPARPSWIWLPRATTAVSADIPRRQNLTVQFLTTATAIRRLTILLVRLRPRCAVRPTDEVRQAFLRDRDFEPAQPVRRRADRHRGQAEGADDRAGSATMAATRASRGSWVGLMSVRSKQFESPRVPPPAHPDRSPARPTQPQAIGCKIAGSPLLLSIPMDSVTTPCTNRFLVSPEAQGKKASRVRQTLESFHGEKSVPGCRTCPPYQVPSSGRCKGVGTWVVALAVNHRCHGSSRLVQSTGHLVPATSRCIVGCRDRPSAAMLGTA